MRWLEIKFLRIHVYSGYWRLKTKRDAGWGIFYIYISCRNCLCASPRNSFIFPVHCSLHFVSYYKLFDNEPLLSTDAQHRHYLSADERRLFLWHVLNDASRNSLMSSWLGVEPGNHRNKAHASAALEAAAAAAAAAAVTPRLTQHRWTVKYARNNCNCCFTYVMSWMWVRCCVGFWWNCRWGFVNNCRRKWMMLWAKWQTAEGKALGNTYSFLTL